MVPAPLNPARLKQMKAEASAGGDPLSGVPPGTDAYPKKRSRRRSIGKKPDANTETLVQRPPQGSREHRRSRDISYAASEIYEPDWALSPFPANIVGTFSCHGIEPSYFTNGAMAKINQDRGRDLRVLKCRGAFTPSTRLVSISRCRGWFLCRV